MKTEIYRIKDSPYIITEKQWKHIEGYLNKIIEKVGFRKIILLPRIAYNLLQKQYLSNEESNTHKTCVSLGIIAWAAWTAIDEIRDEEQPDSDYIVIFLILRPIVDELIDDLCLQKKLSDRLIGKISIMEHVNSKIYPTPIKSHYILKSIAVSVPLLALMMKIETESKYIKLCQKYFYHLIGARQLSDDALDWPEDMKKDQHTLVTQWLIETVGKDRSVREYRKAFNKIVSPRVARKILRHSRLSMSYARKMTCFTSTEFLEELPRFYETMATNILKEYKLKTKKMSV